MVRIRTVLNIVAYLVAFFGVAPLFPYLDFFGTMAIPLAFLWGGLADFRRRDVIKAKYATILSFVLFFWYASQFSMANFIDPIVHILALMLAIRLISEKSARHYLQIFVLAIFTLASSSLLSLGPIFFVYLVLIILLVTISLVLLSFFAVDEQVVFSKKEAKRVISYASILPLGSLLLMFFFFAILPRTEHPLWNFLNPEGGGVSTGFSETVEPGTFSELSSDQSIAFRADSPKVSKDKLYWRGIVLDSFDGKKWVRERRKHSPERVVGGTLVEQTIYPKGDSKGYVIGLSLLVNTSETNIRKSGDYVFWDRSRGKKKKKYSVSSRLDAQYGITDKNALGPYLQVPDEISVQVLNASKSITDTTEDPIEKYELLNKFFIAQKLSYSNKDLPVTDDPVTTFLFDSRAGYCEYFASSYAVMLRLMNIPARLVGGYYGGDYSDLGGYYLVTESMAHVWVEGYLGKRGWVLIDPSRLAINSDVAVTGSQRSSLGGVSSLLDLIDYYWTQAVITYDFKKQLSTAVKTRSAFRELTRNFKFDRQLIVWFLPVLAIVALFMLRGSSVSAEEKLALKFRQQVEQRWFPDGAPDSVGIMELAEKTDNQDCMTFARTYCQVVFTDRKLSGEEKRELRQLIRIIGKG